MLLLAVSKMGTTLKCQQCNSLSSEHVTVRCNATTVECPGGQCYTLSVTTSEDVSVVAKGCDEANSYCGDVDTACPRVEQLTGTKFKSCHGSCCSTDFCNHAEEIMAVKAFICLMAIAGYFLA